MLNRKSKQSGFTLLEMTTALAGASVLIVGLASTIVISSQLITNSRNNDQFWRDREIADRIETDLRYCKSVSTTGSRFLIERPVGISADQSLEYTSDFGGLTRRVDSGAAIPLDPEAPSLDFSVDGFTAPTTWVEPAPVRVHSVRTAGTDFASDNLTVAHPTGMVSGDLLILGVASKGEAFIAVPGWNLAGTTQTNGLKLSFYYQHWSAPLPEPTIWVFPKANSAAINIGTQGARHSFPLADSASGIGFASAGIPSTHAVPLGDASSQQQLNLQLTGASGAPWPDSLGLQGFVDVAQQAGSLGDPNEISIAVTARNGPLPELTGSPTAIHLHSGSWAQTGIILGATQ